MALMFSLLSRHVLLAKAHFLSEEMSLGRRRHILNRVRLGLIPYALATPLAFVSPYITLGVCGALAVYYATPLASGAAD